jgi:hypothetical protein
MRPAALSIFLAISAAFFALGVSGCSGGCADDCGGVAPQGCAPGSSWCESEDTIATCDSMGLSGPSTKCEANTTCVFNGSRATCASIPMEAGTRDAAAIYHP